MRWSDLIGDNKRSRYGTTNNVNTKEIQARKHDLKLTKRQRAIVVGLLLGDGHLETQNNKHTYRLKVEHSIAQADYVRWLFQELRDWIPASAPYVKIRANGERNVGFTTYSHSSLRFYGHQFYYEKKKLVPSIIAKITEPISIAVWFMDDGSRKSNSHRTYVIHTLGYTKKDVELLQQMLEKKFNIGSRLHRQKEKYWRLYIPSNASATFELLIEKYVQAIPSMRHKLVTKSLKSNGGVY